MTEDDTKSRHKAERERRLQIALRENLKRRKAQARGRASEMPRPQEETGETAEEKGD